MAIITQTEIDEIRHDIATIRPLLSNGCGQHVAELLMFTLFRVLDALELEKKRGDAALTLIGNLHTECFCAPDFECHNCRARQGFRESLGVKGE